MIDNTQNLGCDLELELAKHDHNVSLQDAMNRYAAELKQALIESRSAIQNLNLIVSRGDS